MKTSKYSIIFASLRKVTQEKVSLGLVLSDGETVFCKFSYSKLAGLKSLVGKQEFKIIHESVYAIEAKITQNATATVYDSQQLYQLTDSSFGIDYINYLSRYKNNLIIYSEPKSIDVETTAQNALKLFSTLIGEEKSIESTIISKTYFIDDFSRQYAEEIKKHFIVGHTVSINEVPNLVVPVKVDFIGQNGLDVFVQSVDMTASPTRISNEITSFYWLKETYKKNGKALKDFLLTEEPPNKMRKQHDIWTQLRDAGQFNHIDMSESKKIIEYAEDNNVKPVFGNIDNSYQLDDSPF